MVQRTITPRELQYTGVKLIDHIDPWRLIIDYLVNSAESNNMAVDGSGGAPQVFSYTPPDDYDAIINGLSIYLQCSSAMSVAVFGNLGAALGQGIEIKAVGVLLVNWKDNIDMYTTLSEVDTLSNVSDQAADTALEGRWAISRNTNESGILVPNGESFEIIINDDLSSITAFRARLKGKLIVAQ